MRVAAANIAADLPAAQGWINLLNGEVFYRRREDRIFIEPPTQLKCDYRNGPDYPADIPVLQGFIV